MRPSRMRGAYRVLKSLPAGSEGHSYVSILAAVLQTQETSSSKSYATYRHMFKHKRTCIGPCRTGNTLGRRQNEQKVCCVAQPHSRE